MRFEYFTKKEHITFRLETAYKDRIKAAAKADNMCVSTWFTQAAIEFLQLPVARRIEAGQHVASAPTSGKIMTNLSIAPVLRDDIEKDVAALRWESNTFWYHAAMQYKLANYTFRRSKGVLAAVRQQESDK